MCESVAISCAEPAGRHASARSILRARRSASGPSKLPSSSRRWREVTGPVTVELEFVGGRGARGRRRSARPPAIGSDWPKRPSIRWSGGRSNCSTPGWCGSRSPGTIGRAANGPTPQAGRRWNRYPRGNSVFKGLGNLANLGSLLKQAQQMGGQLEQVTEELKSRRVDRQRRRRHGRGRSQRPGRSPPLPHRSVAVGPGRPRAARRPGAGGHQPGHGQEPRQMHAEAMKSLAGGLDLPGPGRHAGASFSG